MWWLLRPARGAGPHQGHIHRGICPKLAAVMAPQPLPDLPATAGDLWLGIDQPGQSWPTAPRLKSYEAAGFGFVQVTLPPRAVLRDPAMVATHAGALRRVLELTGLAQVLHAPTDLMAGDREGDACLRGALDYSLAAGAGIFVYHGRRVVSGAAGGEARLGAERRSLARLTRRAQDSGITLALENLAPVYPGDGTVGCDPAALLDLVVRLDSPAAGICLDIGHANIVAGCRGVDLLEMIEPLLAHTLLFHLHDNFGAGTGGERSGSIDPLRLDLHLVPGAGNVPWSRLAPRLAAHGAPLGLEVRAPARPEPGTLAVVMRELLGRGSTARA
jgi:sugar phosphate isomerase/epimerase